MRKRREKEIDRERESKRQTETTHSKRKLNSVISNCRLLVTNSEINRPTIADEFLVQVGDKLMAVVCMPNMHRYQ